MKSKAYYGVDIKNYADATFNDLQILLTRTLMPYPHLWNMVKYVYEDVEESNTHMCKAFKVIFNDVADDLQAKSFCEKFDHLQYTSVHPIEF